MGLLDGLIENVAMPLIRASQEADKEKRRQELRKGSIDAEFKIIGETIVESKELAVKGK